MSNKAAQNKKSNRADAFAFETEGKHPKQHVITLALSNKKKIDIVTNWGKEGETLKADVDPFNHPAWQENSQSFVNVNDDRISKFNKKFGGFGDL